MIGSLISRMAISAYWDKHKDQIEAALISVNSMNELYSAVSRIVAECVMGILRTATAA